MANILTAAEAAVVLRTISTDQALLALLPQVDAYIQHATGRDWTTDTTIHPVAKAAARILLVRGYEDPGALGQVPSSLSWGVTACLAQLEAIAQQYKTFAGRDGAGACTLTGARVGDTVSTLTGLVGSTGDQKSSFESVITVDDEIQQSSTLDLSAKWYRIYLISPESL